MLTGSAFPNPLREDWVERWAVQYKVAGIYTKHGETEADAETGRAKIKVAANLEIKPHVPESDTYEYLLDEWSINAIGTDSWLFSLSFDIADAVTAAGLDDLPAIRAMLVKLEEYRTTGVAVGTDADDADTLNSRAFSVVVGSDTLTFELGGQGVNAIANDSPTYLDYYWIHIARTSADIITTAALRGVINAATATIMVGEDEELEQSELTVDRVIATLLKGKSSSLKIINDEAHILGDEPYVLGPDTGKNKHMDTLRTTSDGDYWLSSIHGL